MSVVGNLFNCFFPQVALRRFEKRPFETVLLVNLGAGAFARPDKAVVVRSGDAESFQVNSSLELLELGFAVGHGPFEHFCHVPEKAIFSVEPHVAGEYVLVHVGDEVGGLRVRVLAQLLDVGESPFSIFATFDHCFDEFYNHENGE